MKTQTENVLDYYRATAGDYRLLWTGPRDLAIHFGFYEKGDESHEEAVLKMNEELAKRARITRADRILDAGCGYGGSALWLAENIGCEVHGVTLVPAQAAKALSEVGKRGLSDRVRIECLDFHSLPFPEASFDVVWALESVPHAEDRAAFLREARRLLKDTGRLVLAEAVLREDRPLDAEEREMTKTWLHGWAVPGILTEQNYRKLLESAGFSHIEFHDVTRFVEPSSRRLKNITRITLPLARLFHALRILGKERLENTRAAYLQYDLLKRGSWRYVIVTAQAFMVQYPSGI